MNRKYLVRQGQRPLLVPDDMPCEANAVLNPGVAEVEGEIILLLRVENKDGISHIRVARSPNGVDGWRIARRPLLEPGHPRFAYEAWGCEDARVTRMDSNEWVIAYTAFTEQGPSIAVATTSDFDTVERLGPAFIPGNKDAAVFPRRFDRRLYMLHRPDVGGNEDIWYASAMHRPTQWSQPGLLMSRRAGPYWDSQRIGAGCPPILTKHGWLLIYHGSKAMGSRSIYRLGVALLDLAEPTKVLARSNDWVFGPEAEYEMQGLMPGVVFTCGAVVRGDEIWMYYGAADTSVGLAVGKIQGLLDILT